MKTSEHGLKFIAGFEGLSLVAYPDPQSGGPPWTIGFGHTHGVKEGDTCTLEEAYDLLDQDLMIAEDAIARQVKVPLTQGEYDALASFIHNFGETKFAKSTLLRLLNQMRYDAAAEEFLKWVSPGSSVEAGLTRRRRAERELFLGD